MRRALALHSLLCAGAVQVQQGELREHDADAGFPFRWNPFGKRSTELSSKTETVETETVETSPSEKVLDTESDDTPHTPGCYKRFPTGCWRYPNSARMSEWQHDAVAEEEGSLLDEASCKKRKIVWDHYCSVKDSQVVFVPGRLGGGDARVALSVSTTLPSAPQLLEDESWDHQGTWGSSSSAPAAEQPAPGPPPPVAPEDDPSGGSVRPADFPPPPRKPATAPSEAAPAADAPTAADAAEVLDAREDAPASDLISAADTESASELDVEAKPLKRAASPEAEAVEQRKKAAFDFESVDREAAEEYEEEKRTQAEAEEKKKLAFDFETVDKEAAQEYEEEKRIQADAEEAKSLQRKRREDAVKASRDAEEAAVAKKETADQLYRKALELKAQVQMDRQAVEQERKKLADAEDAATKAAAGVAQATERNSQKRDGVRVIEERMDAVESNGVEPDANLRMELSDAKDAVMKAEAALAEKTSARIAYEKSLEDAKKVVTAAELRLSQDLTSKQLVDSQLRQTSEEDYQAARRRSEAAAAEREASQVAARAAAAEAQRREEAAAKAAEEAARAAAEAAPAAEEESRPKAELRAAEEATAAAGGAAAEAAGAAEAAPRSAAGSSTESSQDGERPTGPGCYMKMPSGCQSRTSRTERWRRDKWAEEHALDSDGCMGRRVVWNEYCQREDVEVIFVGGSSMSSSKSLSTLQLGAKEAWPWSKKRGKAEEAEAQTKVDADTQVKVGAEADSEVDYPDEPGCYMRMPSGCPKNPMKTDLWRHDAWAENHDLDEAGCKGRKYVWDKFCEAGDAKMVFVRNIGNLTLVEPARPVNLFRSSPSWPWSRKREKAEESQAQAKADAEADSEVDYPDEPGCYMRMPSGCPKNPMKTDLWRHDAWAEHHDLDEAGCKGRKYVWDKFCAASDSKMVFVRNVDNVTLVEPARPVNLFRTSPSWPWSKKRQTSEEPQAQAKADAEADSEVDYPDEPGCYMRMPSGCPKNPMKTDLWRHDAWAEHHDLDEAGCKGRKYVWDKFCAASDSKMVFVRSVDNVTLVEPARPVNLFSASPSWPWSTVRANAGGAETKPKAEGDEEEE